MKLLMVCLGNICRSPMAEGIMRNKLPDEFTVDSAGTISQHEGEHPDARATETARRHGVDISRLRSRPITREDLVTFDRIYCMDLHNMADVVSMAETEEQRDKVRLFLQEAGDHANAEVPDPYFGGTEAFERVFALLNRASDVISRNLLKRN